jgi:hypothetical protein
VPPLLISAIGPESHGFASGCRANIMVISMIVPSPASLPLRNTLKATQETTMRKLNSFKAKARALARSGYFYGLPPLEFELSFEEGSTRLASG